MVADEPRAEDLARLFEQVKSWGRFGPDDERGALNYVSDAKRAAAAALVREGHAVSCSRELPVEPSPENPRPAQHHMLRAGDAAERAGDDGYASTGDYIGVAFHGMATSHLDALCHVLVGGRSDGIFSRGVLLDVPRARGVRWLEPRERIRRRELEAAERTGGARVEEGDVLLISTGRDARRAALGPWDPLEVGLAGLHPDCIPWLHERRIAVLGSDGVSDPLPATGIPGWPIPVHQCCLVAMGVHLLDNLALAELADACAARGRSEFLFVVAPLRIEGGTGSPVNPLAIF